MNTGNTLEPYFKYVSSLIKSFTASDNIALNLIRSPIDDYIHNLYLNRLGKDLAKSKSNAQYQLLETQKSTIEQRIQEEFKDSKPLMKHIASTINNMVNTRLTRGLKAILQK